MDIDFIAHRELEAPICGHGTIALGKYLLSHPNLTPPGTKTLSFTVPLYGTLTVSKVHDDLLELEMPAAVMESIDTEDDRAAKIHIAVGKALGLSDGEKTPIVSLGKDISQGFEHILLIELDASVVTDLKSQVFIPSELVRKSPPRPVSIS